MGPTVGLGTLVKERKIPGPARNRIKAKQSLYCPRYRDSLTDTLQKMSLKSIKYKHHKETWDKMNVTCSMHLEVRHILQYISQ
jgi:hypothetical protein